MAGEQQPGFARRIESIWYDGAHYRSLLFWCLLPFSLLYWFVTAVRRTLYRFRLLPSSGPGVPVIVVGNIVAGGAGKTPVVIWLARQLAALGYKPGIVSRGYGGERSQDQMPITGDSDPAEAGDEPVLIARATGFPVMVGSKRAAAAKKLAERDDVNIIVSDDGLQHYALGRDFELVVVDAVRRNGNGFVLPAGPLRELAGRLHQADQVVVNGGSEDEPFSFQLIPGPAVHLGTGEHKPLQDFAGQTVSAVAGIGNPARFYELLSSAGVQPEPLAVPDHGRLPEEQLRLSGTVIMTEKDAIKYSASAGDDWWYIPVKALFSAEDEQALADRIQAGFPLEQETG